MSNRSLLTKLRAGYIVIFIAASCFEVNDYNLQLSFIILKSAQVDLIAIYVGLKTY